MFFGNQNCEFDCERCLSSYSSQNVLSENYQRCEQQEKTSIGNSNQSHLNWKKKHFHWNPICFRIYADFETDDANDDSIMGNKTTIFRKQNPVCKGYYIIPDLDDILQSGSSESPLAYDNVGWFVNEVI